MVDDGRLSSSLLIANPSANMKLTFFVVSALFSLAVAIPTEDIEVKIILHLHASSSKLQRFRLGQIKPAATPDAPCPSCDHSTEKSLITSTQLALPRRVTLFATRVTPPKGLLAIYSPRSSLAPFHSTASTARARQTISIPPTPLSAPLPPTQDTNWKATLGSSIPTPTAGVFRYIAFTTPKAKTTSTPHPPLNVTRPRTLDMPTRVLLGSFFLFNRIFYAFGTIAFLFVRHTLV